MIEFIKEKDADAALIRDKLLCPHHLIEIRRRTISNGSIQYVNQCLVCGKPVGSAIKKEKVKELTIVDFDNSLLSAWEKYRDFLWREHDIKFSKDKFFESYSDYLFSDEWREKRAKVLERAKGICEACLSNKATQVHHKPGAYRHEFLFNLVAVCDNCHEALHGNE